MDLEELQCAEIMFRLASQLLYGEPRAEQMGSFVESGLFEEVPFGASDEAVSQGAALMAGWCASHAGDDAEAFGEAVHTLRSEHFMLFVGAGAPKAPSWSGFYLTPKSQLFSELTLQIRRTYRSWGLQMETLNKEPDDNLGILLGFLSHLIGIEAAGGQDAEAARQAQGRVLRDWVLPWICAWRWSVGRNASTDFFRGLGELTFGLVRCYAQRFGLQYVDAGANSRFVERPRRQTSQVPFPQA